MTACLNCGHESAGVGTPREKYPPEHCDQCPPWRCDDCGEMCSAAALCSCWVQLDQLALADQKALFARIDLSLNGRRGRGVE